MKTILLTLLISISAQASDLIDDVHDVCETWISEVNGENPSHAFNACLGRDELAHDPDSFLHTATQRDLLVILISYYNSYADSHEIDSDSSQSNYISYQLWKYRAIFYRSYR